MKFETVTEMHGLTLDHATDFRDIRTEYSTFEKFVGIAKTKF